MERTLAKRVLLTLAADAHELSTLFHYANATWFPGRPQFVWSMCEGAVRISAHAVVVMPAEAHLVRETLETDVTGLSASKAHEFASIVFHEA